MELRTFIKKTLLDIINAVQDAQKEVGDSVIVPKGTEGKLGVVNSFIGAGVAGKSSADKKQSNILKFRIPVQLPTSGCLKLDSN